MEIRGSAVERLPPLVDAIRAIAFREARDAGAQFINDEWVSKRVFRSKLWVRSNWEKKYLDVYHGDIWPPGSNSLEAMDVDEDTAVFMKEKMQRQKYLKTRPTKTPVQAISELPPTDVPVPFIEEDSSGYFKINEIANLLLSSIDKPVCVVAIAGKYRTGKSFLMNRLFGRNSGFPLGGTIQSQTKGIWMWQRPHPDDPSKSLLLLDTEGLYDVEKGDATHDMKLFTLAVLLSTVIVFNVQCTIDDAMIQQLHLVSKLTENIKTKNTAHQEEGAEFSKHFPTFVMVVRDFFLELKINGKDCTANEYLENSLKVRPGHSKDVEKYNAPREAIREFFTKRKCFVLPKPVDDVEKLRKLETVHEDNLKVDFLKKSDEAVREILREAKIFKVDAETMTASRFAELANVYVETLNSGGVPCIESAVSMLREVECRKAKEDALACYISVMMATASRSMPMEVKQLSSCHMSAMDEATQVFQKKALFDEEGQMVKELLDELNAMYLEYVRQNEEESSHMCLSYLQLSFSEIDSKIQSRYYIKEDGYEEYKEDCDLASTMYMSYPDKGPMAQTKLTDFLQQRRNEGYTILNSDKALTQKAREIREQQAEREHQELLAQAEQERNEALRQQLLDEQENNRKMLHTVQREMESKLSEQKIQHDQLVQQKSRQFEEMQRQGNRRASELQRQLQDLHEESRNMAWKQEQVNRQIQECQQENANLMSQIRQAEASSTQKIKQLQTQVQQASQPRHHHKKGCVVM